MSTIISKEPIRQFTGKIIGWYETDNRGNIQVREFTGTILGWYDAQHNVTREFSGMIIGKGNLAGVLLAKARID